MGNTFNLRDYPQGRENIGASSRQDQNLPKAYFAAGEEAPQANADTGVLPASLESWYRGGAVSFTPQPAFSAPQKTGNFLFSAGRQAGIQNKAKSIFKNSLQIFTVTILIIVAGIIGGFVFLDRKVNLDATQASLGRMSEVLAQESLGTASTEARATVSDQPIVPQIAKVEGTQESRVFNTSGNTNVDSATLPVKIDSDQDGLSDEIEDKLATNPFQADTDGDGYADGVEVKNGYDPLTPAAKKASAVSTLPSNVVPQVAAAQEQACSLQAQDGSSAETTGGSCNFSQAGSTDFSQLSADDYSSLQNFGLSTEDITQASTGNLDNSGKLSLQEKIIASPSMQGSMTDMLDAVPKLALPTIPDSELNLYTSSSKEDIENYLRTIDQIFEKDLSSVASLDRESFKNQILNGDYTELAKVQAAFQNAYRDLKAVKTPQDAKEVQKSFLAFFQIYANLVSPDIAASQDPNKVAAVLAQVKSFEDLSANMQKAFTDLGEKYGLN